MNAFQYDLVIIGAGGAGLASAIYAMNSGLRVAVVSKVHPMQSHTASAQGGINAALGNITHDDPDWHIYDTIKASDWIADQDAVEIMCQKAFDAISMLDALGVDFNKNQNGSIDQKVYGGQSTNYGKGDLAFRACYSADRTGIAILSKLYQKAVENSVDFFNYHFAIDLIINDGAICGVTAWDIDKGGLKTIYATNTIIATGGYSNIYQTSTSSSICTGDGNGLAVKAGINLQDMEFVQFHPTAIKDHGVLITEAARSAGGKLLNRHGVRFMDQYAPKFRELASRDIVARSIFQEISLGNGCGADKDHVLLDITHMTADEIQQNLPTVFENCKIFLDLDPSMSPIPIVPASHYTMGGIPTNVNCQVVRYSEQAETIVPNLYAIGEAASISVHGAGRLGCNSLLDLIVFSNIVVSHIVNSTTKPIVTTNLQVNSINHHIKEQYASESNIKNLQQDLKLVMQKNVGVFRNQVLLSGALDAIQSIEQEYNSLQIVKDFNSTWNLELKDYLELGNQIISAKATIESAIWRKESRGAHWREDYPTRDDKNFLCHTIYLQSQHCISREVRTLKDGKRAKMFRPVARVY